MFISSARSLYFPHDRKEVRQYLARASVLDDFHRNILRAFIDNLVSGGVFDKCYALWFLSTQDTTAKLFNLISTSYTLTVNGAPAFVADRGYTGENGNTTTKWLDTGLNLNGTDQNSLHLSAWCNTATAAGVNGGYIIGCADVNTANTGGTWINPRNEADLFSGRANNNSSLAPANTDGKGHFVINRSAASGAGALVAYKNAGEIGNAATASSTPLNGNIYLLAENDVGLGARGGSDKQLAAASVGMSLTPQEVAAFYASMSKAMTAVGNT